MEKALYGLSHVMAHTMQNHAGVCAFGGRLILFFAYGVKSPKNIFGAWIGVFEPKTAKTESRCNVEVTDGMSTNLITEYMSPKLTVFVMFHNFALARQ